MIICQLHLVLLSLLLTLCFVKCGEITAAALCEELCWYIGKFCLHERWILLNAPYKIQTMAGLMT